MKNHKNLTNKLFRVDTLPNQLFVDYFRDCHVNYKKMRGKKSGVYRDESWGSQSLLIEKASINTAKDKIMSADAPNTSNMFRWFMRTPKHN